MIKIFALLLFAISAASISAQEIVIVQPGAPGQPTKRLASDTRAKLPPIAAKDVEFMQGMIMHHSQAVEMTDWIADRTENKDIRKIGAKISQSQADEIKFMKRWLESRGKSTEMPSMDMPEKTENKDSSKMSGMDHSKHMDHSKMDHAMMPGMLTPKQMEALKNSKGKEFDKLFLSGMIQHHGGAIIMVKDLFSSAGAGQDAELFNFASDVDTGQRGEIKIMQNLLNEITSKEKK